MAVKCENHPVCPLEASSGIDAWTNHLITEYEKMATTETDPDKLKCIYTAIQVAKEANNRAMDQYMDQYTKWQYGLCGDCIFILPSR